VAANQGRVDVEDEVLGAGAEREGALARRLAGGAEALKLGRPDPLQHPKGGGVRGDVAEQVGLVAKRGQVTEVLAASHQGDDQIAHDLAVIVDGAALAGRRQRLAEPPGQAQPIGHAGEQKRAGLRAETLAVRRYLYGLRATSTVHLQGDAS
jgi:hypothetical protein